MLSKNVLHGEGLQFPSSRVTMANDMEEKETIVQQCFRQLRAEILSGEIAPGTRLRLRPIAQRLGVAHNTIGEALRFLDKEGLVEFEPRVGAKVCERDFETVKGDYILRLALETEAVRRVATQQDAVVKHRLQSLARRADEEAKSGDAEALHEADLQFHLAVAEAAGSKALLEALTPLLSRLIVADQFSPDDPKAAPTHEAIIEAAFAKGPEEGIRLMRDHIEDALCWAVGR